MSFLTVLYRPTMVSCFVWQTNEWDELLPWSRKRKETRETDVTLMSHATRPDVAIDFHCQLDHDERLAIQRCLGTRRRHPVVFNSLFTALSFSYCEIGSRFRYWIIGTTKENIEKCRPFVPLDCWRGPLAPFTHFKHRALLNCSRPLLQFNL